MSKDDITLTPAGSVGDKPAIAGKPIYLVIVEEGLKVKSLAYYLCQKLDKEENYVEFRGQPCNLTLDKITTADPQTLFDATKTQELTYPWLRIFQIRNLSFKSTK